MKLYLLNIAITCVTVCTIYLGIVAYRDHQDLKLVVQIIENTLKAQQKGETNGK